MGLVPPAWPRPTSLYVHVPFCVRRCGYCNFSVVAGREDLHERMVSALITELERAANDPSPLNTIFFGGGTPTQLSDDSLERILDAVRARFGIADDAEVSMEVNPEDVRPERTRRWSAMGINRISLGVQSFRDSKLEILQRGHDGLTARRAIKTVADQISNVSIDLIFAAPGESVSAWREDLNLALSLPITHLSSYALTFEKGTLFWNRQAAGQLSAVPDDDELAMYDLARQMTADAGWKHYEISSFQREDHRCRHNMAYWKGQGWYAVGPGAARFVDGSRDLNHRSPTTYLKRLESGQDPTTEREPIDRETYVRERLAFGVRMMEGIHLNAIARETGYDVHSIAKEAIEQNLRDGFIEVESDHVRLTDHGIHFGDLVAERFL